jgi:hypothetical protein
LVFSVDYTVGSNFFKNTAHRLPIFSNLVLRVFSKYILAVKGVVSSRAHLFCAYMKLETTGCFFKLNKSKMTSARVGTQGGKRDNSGRKRKWPGSENFSSQNKRVYLSLSVFWWREAKNEAG